MASGFSCPFCRQAILLEDVHIANDIALCRSCGKTTSFSVLNGATGIPMEVLDHPPSGISTDVDFQGGKVIVYRKLSPILFFLIPFTAFWSGGSMIGIYGTQIISGEFDLEKSLFGIPFLLGSLILFGVIIYLVFGKWTITLREGVGTVFVGVWGVGWTRSFTYSRETLVLLQTTNVSVNDIPQKGILVRNGPVDFVFGAILKDEAKRFIAAAIKKETEQAPPGR